MLLLLLVGLAAATLNCNHNDHLIYERIGHTFPTLFRGFGGMFTGQPSFEAQVVQHTGLSATCAKCYGDSYTCGKDNCKMSCAWASASCTQCLSDYQCTQKCDACTGFK